GARRGFVFTHGEDVVAAGDRVEHGLVVLQRVARLIDVRDLDRGTDLHFAGIRLFFSGDQFEQRGFTRAVRADDADDRAGRHLEAEVVDQQAVTIRFAHTFEFDDLIAESLADRDEYLLRLVALLVFLRIEFFEAGDTRLGFRLASFGILPHPFQLLLHRLHVRVDLFVFCLQPRFLLLQPARVIALPRDAVAAIQFEY